MEFFCRGEASCSPVTVANVIKIISRFSIAHKTLKSKIEIENLKNKCSFVRRLRFSVYSLHFASVSINVAELDSKCVLTTRPQFVH